MTDGGDRQRRLAHLSFPIDRFQDAAIEVLDRGESVLVAAPTGSGKTVIAEYAIHRCVDSGRRAFYTAPIKALSNQKFNDLRSIWGDAAVGLLTGDNAINSDAPIVVMTTEVLRNMIYARSSAVDELGVVILDEVHFLQDAYRGPVWEEVIIHLPPEVQLVCLSATVSNADEIADWLTTVRGPTRSVVESKRPVPLQHVVAYGDARSNEVTFDEVLRNGRTNEELTNLLARNRNVRRRAGSSGKGSRLFSPSRSEVVDLLRGEDLLPAIYFIFSRQQCDEAARACVRLGMSLTSHEERALIAGVVDERLADISVEDLAVLGFSDFSGLLENGIAAHHAGMVPIFREIVEELFVRGLIKVVFATETLAVGLNMPARSVVIDKLSKFAGDHHHLLTPAEFTQLTGRAGRRGIDTEGVAVVAWNGYLDIDHLVTLATSRSFRLTSSFRPTYNMAAHLVRAHSREQAQHLLDLSLAQYQASKGVVDLRSKIERRRRERDRLRAQASSTFGDIDDYRRRHEAPIRDRSAIEASLHLLAPGDVITWEGDPVVVLATAARSKGMKVTTLDGARKVRALSADDFDSGVDTIGHLDTNGVVDQRDSRALRELAHRVHRLGPRRQRATTIPEYHPVEEDPDLVHKINAAKSADRIDKELAALEARMTRTGRVVSRRFDEVVDVLTKWGYVDGWALTERGTILTRVFHESDLLVSECIADGIFDDLDPASLAAVASAFVYEHRGVDPAPPPVYPSTQIKARCQKIVRISQRLARDESEHGLPLHRAPDPQLTAVTWAWAQGGDLGDVLPEDLVAGDFVRLTKQTVDLVRQIANVATGDDTRQRAQEAEKRLVRGIIAASTGVENR
ncbi:MAG: DEAD/DEAH box helicase [Ilumatobacteraceae bacterium]